MAANIVTILERKKKTAAAFVAQKDLFVSSNVNWNQQIQSHK